MEKLLKDVTSVRRDIEERRKARPKIDNFQDIDLRLEMLSPQSKTQKKSISKLSTPSNKIENQPVPIQNKSIANEFSRYLFNNSRKSKENQIKVSPIRKRTYKLDAAGLLVNRIMHFIQKKFRIWQENAEKMKKIEKSIGDSKRLVFKINTENPKSKRRYVSEKLSDDEDPQKSYTSRFSPMSPKFDEINSTKERSIQISNESRAKKIQSIEENLKNLKNFHSNRPSLKDMKKSNEMPSERLFPATTRANSNYSKKIWDKPISKPINPKAFEKILNVFNHLKTKNQKLLFSKSKLRQGLMDFFETVEIKLKSVKVSALIDLKFYVRVKKIIKATSTISKILIDKIAEFFHFMKFRCIVESGFFDDSMDLSSNCDIKECIDSIQKTIDTDNMKKRQDSLCCLVVIPSFVNLMLSVQERVKQRFYKIFINNAFQSLDKITMNKEILSPGEKKFGRCVKKMIRNLDKDADFRIKKCFRQWKLINFEIESVNRSVLQIVNLQNILLPLIKYRLLSIFIIYRHSKISLTTQKKNASKTSNILKASARLFQYLKSIERNAFCIWKKKIEIITNKDFKNNREKINVLCAIITKRKSKIFKLIRNKGKLRFILNMCYLINLCRNFKNILKNNFMTWKKFSSRRNDTKIDKKYKKYIRY